MATYGLATNELCTCPFDETHRVKQSRLQLHVAKCEMRHLGAMKKTCPFNAQHRVDPALMTHHLLNCPDRGPLDKKLVAANTENSAYRGHTGVPSYESQPVDRHENWDAEVDPSAAPGYQPQEEPPNGGIRVSFGRMIPSERRAYYQRSFREARGDAEVEETAERRQDSMPELRAPRSVSYAQVLDKQDRPIHESQNIGLGRGQPTGSISGSSRIAANIYGDQAQAMRQPRSNPNVGLRATYSGLGRGIVVNGAGEHIGAPTPVNDVDVNHIGLGRGVRR